MRRDETPADRALGAILASFPQARNRKWGGVHFITGVPGALSIKVWPAAVVVAAGVGFNCTIRTGASRTALLKNLLAYLTPYVVAAYRVHQRAAELPLMRIDGRKVAAPWELGSVTV